MRPQTEMFCSVSTLNENVPIG